MASKALTNPASRDYSVSLRLSVLGHFAIALAIVVKAVVFPGKPIVYNPTLRVDVVGLPDILKKDLKNVPKAPPATSKEVVEALKKAEAEVKKIKIAKPPKDEPTPKDKEMVYKPKPVSNAAAREKKLKEALSRIKSIEKISAIAENSPAPVIKGNQVSKGSSLSGDAKESLAATYFDALRDRFQENWALPVWIARQKLSAEVKIYVDAHGRLHSFNFLKTSGNAQFDDAVKKAIADSQPLPAPPPEIASSVLSDGILVGFPL